MVSRPMGSSVRWLTSSAHADGASGSHLSRFHESMGADIIDQNPQYQKHQVFSFPFQHCVQSFCPPSGSTRLKSSATHKYACDGVSIKDISHFLGESSDKKFPEVWVSPTPMQNARETIIMVRSSKVHSFNILIPSYIIEPNIITVQPPSTRLGKGS